MDLQIRFVHSYFWNLHVTCHLSLACTPSQLKVYTYQNLLDGRDSASPYIDLASFGANVDLNCWYFVVLRIDRS